MSSEKKFYALLLAIFLLSIIIGGYIDKSNRKEIIKLEIERTKLNIKLLKLQLNEK